MEEVALYWLKNEKKILIKEKILEFEIDQEYHLVFKANDNVHVIKVQEKKPSDGVRAEYYLCFNEEKVNKIIFERGHYKIYPPLSEYKINDTFG